LPTYNSLKTKTNESLIVLGPRICLLAVRHNTQLQTVDLSYSCDSDKYNN